LAGRRFAATATAAAAVAGLAPASASLVARSCQVGVEGTCALMGDPHILTFDRPDGPTFDSFSPGVYHIVRTATLSIQGLFRYTSRFPHAASLTGLSVTGHAVAGHRLVFEYEGPEEWQTGVRVHWDDQLVLQTYPSEFHSADGFMWAKTFRMDPASRHKAGGTLPAYEFNLGNEILVYILMGPDFANAVIRMKKVDGQMDGYCGNFNCDPADDTDEDLSLRGVGGRIDPSRTLFASVASVNSQPVALAPELATCDPTLKLQAQDICKDTGSAHMIGACVFDTCASGSAKVAPVIEAIERTFQKEIQKIRGPIVNMRPSVLPESPRTTAPPMTLPATIPTEDGHGGHIHVGCPCANGTAGGMSGCPCAHGGGDHEGWHVHVGCPCSAAHMEMHCPCAQAHVQQCPCMHSHSPTSPCPCMQQALQQCPCAQAMSHCPCGPHPVQPTGLPPWPEPTTVQPTVQPTAGPTTAEPVLPTGRPGPMMKCDLNCYGESSEAVALPGAKGQGGDLAVEGVNVEVCREFCLDTMDCQGIVFHSGKCYGKRNIVTSKCPPGNGEFTTEILRRMPKGICGLFGDPHIVTFDNPNGDTIDQMSAGEFVLVKGEDLQINGRFGFSERFPSESSTVGIAVAGAVINSHRLTVQYVGPDKGRTGFKAFWDGKEILRQFPSVFNSKDGSLRAEYGMMNPDDEHPRVRHTIGGTPGDVPSYRFNLMPGWKIYVLLGEQTMNAVLEVYQQVGGVDGYCGNFNCDKIDDTLEGLRARGGLAEPVPEALSLFHGGPTVPGFEMKGGVPFRIENCDADLKARAEDACKSMPAKAQRKACVYDACASGSIEQATEDIQVGRMEMSVGALCAKFFSGFVSFGQEQAPFQFFGMIGMAAVGALVGCTLLGRVSRRQRRFEPMPFLDDGSSSRKLRLPVTARLLAAFNGGARDTRLSEEVASEHVALMPRGYSHRSAGSGAFSSDEEDAAEGLFA